MSEVSIGVAAHITAAAPGGPRYDHNQSPQERSAVSNGIWMCNVHAKLIDDDPNNHSIELLKRWQREAHEHAWKLVSQEAPIDPNFVGAKAADTARLLAAATADLAVFKNHSTWPPTSVPLELEIGGFEDPVSTTAVAKSSATIEDMIVVAPPGIGKTSAVFQMAEGMISAESGIPLVLPLGDWATTGLPVKDALFKRATFAGASFEDFQLAVRSTSVVLFLDGWNELDLVSRRKAFSEVRDLKALLPELGLVLTTRKQELDVPFEGTLATVLPLNEWQQTSIANEIGGEHAIALIDEALRTPGIRDLVSVPLYLMALLSLPENQSFPETKEELLRCFVSAHEADPLVLEELKATTRGFQSVFLSHLSVSAVGSANTSISLSDARESVSNTSRLLVDAGQITLASEPDPTDLIDKLVDRHLLVRTSDNPGVMFQHQQLQEWYASHDVERRLEDELATEVGRERVKAEILDWPSWEEATLFAVERMARSSEASRDCCAKAIIAALEVDPLLASEMIFRSDDDVWSRIETQILEFIAAWHREGACDRAHRFMMNSGRPEFAGLIWPLISDEDDQVSLKALRNCRKLRSSVLGRNVREKIKSLSIGVRRTILGEFAYRGGIDGIELATKFAQNDESALVVASVARALSFRDAKSHLIELLKDASEEVFEELGGAFSFDHLEHAGIQAKLSEARAKFADSDESGYAQLTELLEASDLAARGKEVTEAILGCKVENAKDATGNVIRRIFSRQPQAAGEGLRARLLEKKGLFFGADDMLASTGWRIEDPNLLKMALDDDSAMETHGDCAASILGSDSAAALLDLLATVWDEIDNSSSQYDKALADRCSGIESRIGHLPARSLVEAIASRAANVDTKLLVRYAKLISRHPSEADGRSRPYDPESLALIKEFVQAWGTMMLEAGDASRSQIAAVAEMAKRAPDDNLLPVLRSMLDDNLVRFAEFREKAAALGWRSGPEVNEATHPCTEYYKWALAENTSANADAMLEEYLSEEHFGGIAADLLVTRWRSREKWGVGISRVGAPRFEQVGARRERLVHTPELLSDQAETVCNIIEQLLDAEAATSNVALALALAIPAFSVPHGRKDELRDKLLRVANNAQRSKLLSSLLLSGSVIDSGTVIEGLAEALEEAKERPWMLQSGKDWRIRDWLSLAPYSSDPCIVVEMCQLLPDQLNSPRSLERMIRGLGRSPSEGAEAALFSLGEYDARFHENRDWYEAVFDLHSETASIRFVDLIAAGEIRLSTGYSWGGTDRLASMIAEFLTVRARAYRWIRELSPGKERKLIMSAIERVPDPEALMIMVEIEAQEKLHQFGWHTVESVVTEKVPIEDFTGAYTLTPVSVAGLRRSLIELVAHEGGHEAAARCLSIIDQIRDEGGLAPAEPRHPNIELGCPWPISVPELSVKTG